MLCDDPIVQSLATRNFNLSDKAERADFRALGDAWWDASAERDVVERRQFQTAAVYFYARVKTTLDPKKRADATIQKRLDAVSANADKGRRLPSLIEIPLREDVRLRLRLIPAGTYLMGSPPFEMHHSPIEAQKPVTIAQAFYMGRTEVTQQQCFTLLPGGNFCAFSDDDRLPVDNVTWDRTAAFFEKRNVIPSSRGYRFRLPTAAEWEYAFRAGSRTAYFFGDDPSGLSAYAWTADVAAARTHPVGRKKPNPWGLFDILGNVREWTADRFDPANPAQLTESERAERADLRVVRGGDYADRMYQCRSAAMRGQILNHRRDFTGFRIACDIPLND